MNEHKSNNLKIGCSYGNGYFDSSKNKGRDSNGDYEEEGEDDY
jgi:hypothetical protein